MAADTSAPNRSDEPSTVPSPQTDNDKTGSHSPDTGAIDGSVPSNSQRARVRLPSLWLYALVFLILIVELIVGFDLYAESPPSDGGVDLSSSDLDGQVFSAAGLFGAIFRDASLEGAVFTGSVLKEADFARACLLNAHFELADLSGAVLTAADLRGADFSGAKLADTVFAGAVYDNSTQWADATMPAPEEAIDASDGPWMACESVP